MYYEFEGINSFLVGMSKELIAKGVRRDTRGKICYELPHPVMIKIKNPTARIVTIPERKWNWVLPYIESLALALGNNSVEMLVHYLKKLQEFSDDGNFFRGGYGPRFRFYSGISNDYQNDGANQVYEKPINIEIDQYEFVLQSFKRDNFTRQGVITVGDPPKDCFSSPHVLKFTKDFPCTKSLHFQRNGDSLDLIVHMRSNDFIWGAGGVNLFNYTFIQEYFAKLLGLDIGSYYHMVDNMHYYDYHHTRVKQLSEVTTPEDVSFVYPKTFRSLVEFDQLLQELKEFEHRIRVGQVARFEEFSDPFFNDWAKIIYAKALGMSADIVFLHPSLNTLRNQELAKKRIHC